MELADNGTLNETIMDEEPMKKWREDDPGEFPAVLVSHDLDQENGD